MGGGVSLPDIWLVLIVLLALAYVFTDGADLGVGILCLLTGDERRRGLAIASVEGVWHANQTWLVIMGGVLFGAFPLGYGAILSALYLPIFLLLLGLMLRAVSFEFRGESGRKGFWSVALGAGSVMVTLAQGLALGGLLGGIRVEGDQFAGGLWDWVNPLCLPAVAGLGVAYTLFGATWVAGKTADGVRAWALRVGRVAAVLAVAAAILLGVTVSRGRPVWPIAAAVFLGLYFWSVARGRRRRPYLWVCGAVGAGILGLARGLYPVLVPPAITASQAAAPQATLLAMLVVMELLIPVLPAYNAYQFWVFRGPVGHGEYGGEDA